MKLCYAFIIFGAFGTSKCLSPGAPVILVPGDGGSEIEAKLDKPSSIHVYCAKKTDDFFSLWLNLELITPFVIQCFVDNFRLVYDNKTRSTDNSPGVSIRVPGFGNTSTVEWLDSSQIKGTSYFAPIADALVKWGYTRNLNIRGAPYDFRKSPNEMQELLVNMKKLIEETYMQNKNQRVILIAHSMGNPVVLYLLNRETQAWKDKYIKSFVALGAPWGGAVKPLRLMSSGDNLGVFVVDALTVRPEQRSMTSTAWLMPSDSFWKDEEVLVTGPKGNYTVKDYQRFFRDIDFPTGYEMWKDTKDLIYKLTPPGVDVFCFHGSKEPTPAGFVFTESQWPDDQPTVINGDGDGTVNMRSLHGCLRWNGNNNNKKVVHKEFPGAKHIEMLGNKNVIAAIKEVVFS